MDDYRYAAPLREALQTAGYTAEGVAELLGPAGAAALTRNETVPARRRTAGGDPLATLVRLFRLQTAVPSADAERALPGLVEPLCRAGLLAASGSEVAARLDCKPYQAGSGPLWLVSDPTPGLDGAPNRVGPETVLGVSPASTSLAQLTIREPVGRALDLGTGCGIQALHLAEHAGHVVATDVNPRALWLTGLNAALNGVPTGAVGSNGVGRTDGPGGRVEIRHGAYLEPVAGETYHLIVSNPPFVISPATGERLVYRDSGLPGDAAVERIVRTAPDHLAEGGWCQLLANWVVTRDQPWHERLAGWLDERCDAFVVRRELLDPAGYVELWLKDAGLHGGPDYRRRYDTWLAWFEAQGVEAVGLGWINLRRRTGAPRGRTGGAPRREFLEWPYAVEQPVAPAIAAWGAAADVAVDLDTHLAYRADVRQESVSQPGAEHPEAITLRQRRGLCRARGADTVTAGLVGACDGQLSVGQILDALSELLELDPAATRATYLPVVRELVDEGFLEPAP